MPERTLVIGDVHGCLDELRALLVRCSFDASADRLVLLGDLLDRGPDPVGCVQLARELGAESVLGNHEETHLRFRKHRQQQETQPGYKNPMRGFEAERMRQHQALSEDDWAYIEGMPVVLPLAPDFVAVHAGLLPGRPLAEQPRRSMVRLRYLDADGDFTRKRRAPAHNPGDWDGLDYRFTRSVPVAQALRVQVSVATGGARRRTLTIEADELA